VGGFCEWEIEPELGPVNLQKGARFRECDDPVLPPPPALSGSGGMRRSRGYVSYCETKEVTPSRCKDGPMLFGFLLPWRTAYVHAAVHDRDIV